MVDIAHLLRPAHLQSLSNILKDPEASDNDRFVALELLKNANVAAAGVLPGCQDTGTAIVLGKRGQRVLTDTPDEAHLSEASGAPTPGQTCGTRRWPRPACSRRRTPRPTCPPRSSSTLRPGTPTISSSWPRAVAPPTKPTSTSRPRHCSTRRA
ncbi:unnamed protein product [Heterosigma akashiwo]